MADTWQWNDFIGVDTRLKELVKSICEDIQVDVIEMEIMPDLFKMRIPEQGN